MHDDSRSAGRAFQPFAPLRNPHLQSILASSRLRRWAVTRNRRPLEGSREVMLDCPDGVRLQGFHCPAEEQPSRGLVMMLHGWEGCANSTYILSLGQSLHSLGFDIFRLNLRDHGDTHHLNEGLFHSCRLQEVVDAARLVAGRFQARPMMLVGFSLGGNFALRVALQAPEAGIPLAQVVAVNPVIHPPRVMQALEQGPFIYQQYFIRKWRRSLRRKVELFPDLYDMEEWFSLGSLTEKTAYLVRFFDRFESLEDYLQGYSVAGQRLAPLLVPTTILTAADDPIVPVDDFYQLAPNPLLSTEVVPYGGHCGFIENFRLESWVERRVVAMLTGT